MWVSSHLDERGPFNFDTGLRLVAKGFEVSGPTIHSEYLEVPFTASYGRRGSGPFFSIGPYLGVRVHCTRSARTAQGTVSDGCGRMESPLDWTPIRRFEVGGQLDVGLRLEAPTGGAFMLGAGFARSLTDLEAEEWGRTRNEVVTLWIAFDIAR